MTTWTFGVELAKRVFVRPESRVQTPSLEALKPGSLGVLVSRRA
jgi:hypothetical protein